MAKRVGLARTQALIEQLKRELLMGGATFENIKIGGPQTTVGAGLQSGSVAMPITKITNVGGDIVTSIGLDLEDLSGSATGNVVIGNSQGGGAAYLYQHQDSVNGKVYKVEVTCLEDIAGGHANAAFGISGSTLGSYSQGQAGTGLGDPFLVYNMTGSIQEYDKFSGSVVAQPDNDSYMYLLASNSDAGTAGQFTAGKLIIKFYGHEDF